MNRFILLKMTALAALGITQTSNAVPVDRVVQTPVYISDVRTRMHYGREVHHILGRTTQEWFGIAITISNSVSKNSQARVAARRCVEYARKRMDINKEKVLLSPTKRDALYLSISNPGKVEKATFPETSPQGLPIYDYYIQIDSDADASAFAFRCKG